MEQFFFSNYNMAEKFKMTPNTTIFALGPQILHFSADFQNKTCFGSTILYAMKLVKMLRSF
jgi:hypothetical protein